MLSELSIKAKYPKRLYSPFLAVQYVHVKGMRIRYSTEGAGEAILCLHGFPETLQTWRHYSKILSGSFRVITCDLKGFGYSDKPGGDYSPSGMAQFVRDFMEVLKIDAVYLVGTDISTAIACAFAVKYPEKVKKLVLMAGTVHTEAITAPEVKLLNVKPLGEFILRFFGFIAIRMGLVKGFYGRDFVSRELFKEYYAPYKHPDARNSILELLRSFDKFVPLLPEKVKKIGSPTLILWAQNERFFSFHAAQWLNKNIKNSRLETMPCCGHFIQEEKPGESAKAIASFICNEQS